MRALATAFAVVLLLALSPAASVAAPPQSAGEGEGVRSYWTPERMRAAEPLEVDPPSTDRSGSSAPAAAGAPTAVAPIPPGSSRVAELEPTELSGGEEPSAQSSGVNRDRIDDPSAQPFRAHGKVFFTIEGGSAPGDYVCSGTSINSTNGSVVWTAGHCVYDTEGGGFAKNWMFAPAYEDGETPFGEWPAKQLATTKQWKRDGNLSYDLGAVEVETNAEGKTLNDVVGGRGIGFNQARSQTYQAFGYPAIPPPLAFDGETEFRCTSPLEGTDNPPGSGPNTNFIACDMTGGSSGGGWVAGGRVLGVISYSYCLVAICEDNLYGPYQERVAKRLYESTAGAAAFCGGLKVTHLGSAADDRMIGTSGRDVFKAGAGNDRVVGRGGNDRVCAGSGDDLIKGGRGKDRLKGQRGDDTVKGQRGRDKLRGGRGSDLCNGGRGRDSAKGCERERRIP